MTRTVYCVKLKKEAEGLAVPPYPGEKGKWLYDNVSKEAWAAWQQHQTMLINEKRLNLMDPETRKYLTEQMDKYFAGEDYEQAEGYVPPSENE
ncbi:oxidative damage protection protein [Endozoicomonas sp. SM1973]|uniref:Probable Fe(2+)-trafficking protein n=1 Tax=Spartinivicinus marinus TaxID=2994442 RepID=A0A853I5U1_9GAMM|nr:oxidative damage protection protein [Spartinivicinus marinus]MCX4027240.1 oxidative damage protection protein [Spartinivicinus marinus]NYZ66038.1 oxidative damage protection protein [Spartinivicinus marinus]